MFRRSGGRPVVKLLLGGSAVALSAALVLHLDWWRFRADPARLARLSQAPLLTIPAPDQAGDWPQWRGPQRDGFSAETLPGKWPEGGPPVLWRVPVGRGFSSLAVAGGRVYTMMQEEPAGAAAGRASTHEAVVCWDAATGRERWRFRYPNRYDERFGSGPRSTPAVAGGFVYAVGPTGILHCLRADTGAKVWRRDLLEELGADRPRYGVAFSPLIEGDLVITTPGGPGAAVAAFHRRTGKLAWKTGDDPVGYSSPVATSAAGVRQLLVLTNNALLSLRPQDGHLYWRHPWQPAGGFNIATPIPFGDYVFLSSGYGKGCALLEVGTAPDGSLRAGTVYEHRRMRNYFASSVRYGDHIYGFDNAELTCLDVRTGQVAWRERGRFKKGSLLIANGRLIVLGEHGRLALAEATPAGYREQSSFQVSVNKCWTVPALAGGKLYVRDEGQLVCLALRP
jgi:outer membrane protein assembly factor BamB